MIKPPKQITLEFTDIYVVRGKIHGRIYSGGKATYPFSKETRDINHFKLDAPDFASVDKLEAEVFGAYKGPAASVEHYLGKAVYLPGEDGFTIKPQR